MVDTDVFGDFSRAFPLGTDYLGRDMLSRIIFGTRYTIGIALGATVLAVIAGGTLGMLAAVSGGWIDAALSRSFDALISIPSLMFGLVAIAALGSSVPVLVGTAAIIYTPGAFPHLALACGQRRRIAMDSWWWRKPGAKARAI